MADKQKAVDDMAVALFETESLAERLCVRMGKMNEEIRTFRRDCDIHPYRIGPSHQALSEAQSLAATALNQLNMLHMVLDGLREDCSLPGPTPQSGGGGGK